MPGLTAAAHLLVVFLGAILGFISFGPEVIYWKI